MTYQLTKRACSQTDVILRKEALLSFFEDTNLTRQFLENLDYDKWKIISFNVQTRNVCIQIFDNISTRMISITLPTLVNK